MVELLEGAPVVIKEGAEAAELAGCLDQGDGVALLAQAEGHGEAGDAAADDGDVAGGSRVHASVC